MGARALARVIKSRLRAADTRGVTTLSVPHPVMAALSRGIPLTLLVDLADPAGPDSARILSRELADLSWLAGLRDEGRETPAARVRDTG